MFAFSGSAAGGLDAGRAADYTNKRDVVLSPLLGLFIFLLFNPGVARRAAALHPRLLLLWRLRRKKANDIGLDANNVSEISTTLCLREAALSGKAVLWQL
jgi:hypothetical protein